MPDETDDTGKPMRAEFVQMMDRCRSEIKELRARIAFLEPKAAAYDDLSAVLRLLPKQSQGMSEDIVWRLEKRADELRAPAESAVAHHAV